MPGKLRRKHKVSKKVSSETFAPEQPEKAVNTLDHVMVSSGKQSANLWQCLGRRQKLLLGGLIVLALAGLIVFLSRANDKPPAASGPACSAELVKKASTVLEPERVGFLEPMVTEIKQQPLYEQDPNCLYILTTYYINVSDTAAAGDSLDKLDKVYDKSTGYDSAIAKDAKPPEALRTVVDFLKTQDARYQKIGPDGGPR